MRIILPKVYVPPEDITDPLFFFLGPVLGGGDWQFAAYRLLSDLLSKSVAVCPCRYETDHSLYGIQERGDSDRFLHQTNWERFYLKEAGLGKRKGCVIIWLPREDVRKPRDDGNPYARDTYGEIGEWRAHLMYNPQARVVMGAEDRFPGLRVISTNFDDALGRRFPIHKTLRDTVSAAVHMAGV